MREKKLILSHTFNVFFTVLAFDLQDDLLRGIYNHGFEIQIKATVPTVSAKDIMAQAQSGYHNYIFGDIKNVQLPPTPNCSRSHMSRRHISTTNIK